VPVLPLAQRLWLDFGGGVSNLYLPFKVKWLTALLAVHFAIVGALETVYVFIPAVGANDFMRAFVVNIFFHLFRGF
jgi:hypothetical protein